MMRTVKKIFNMEPWLTKLLDIWSKVASSNNPDLIEKFLQVFGSPSTLGITKLAEQIRTTNAQIVMTKLLEDEGFITKQVDRVRGETKSRLF